MIELLDYYEQKQKKLLSFYSISWFVATLILILGLEEFEPWLASQINKIFAVNLNFPLKDEHGIIIRIINLLLGMFVPATWIWYRYGKRLDYIDKEGWKKHFPQNDISGEWLDSSVYTNMIGDKCCIDMNYIVENMKEKETDWVDDDNLVVPAHVIITQTCHEIKIDISHGDGFTWRSLAAVWSDDSLKILYEVTYSNMLRSKGYPQQRFGYEKMTIDKNGLAQNTKPQRMTGQFWHCIANDSKPIFMGDVRYIRQ